MKSSFNSKGGFNSNNRLITNPFSVTKSFCVCKGQNPILTKSDWLSRIKHVWEILAKQIVFEKITPVWQQNPVIMTKISFCSSNQ